MDHAVLDPAKPQFVKDRGGCLVVRVRNRMDEIAAVALPGVVEDHVSCFGGESLVPPTMADRESEIDWCSRPPTTVGVR